MSLEPKPASSPASAPRPVSIVTPAVPATPPTPEIITPSYLCGFATAEPFKDDNLHNPIGIPGKLYCNPNRAMALLNESLGGRIPLDRFPPGSEVWLHLPMGTTLSRMAIDAARNVSAEWKHSVETLVRTLVGRGVRVVVYVGAMHYHVNHDSASLALMEYVQAACTIGFDLAVDSAATMAAQPYAGELWTAMTELVSKGRTFYAEGMWSAAMFGELGQYGAWQFLELQSVERSFTDGWDPAKFIRPNPARLVIWDQYGRLSSRDEVRLAARSGLPEARAGMTSAIGAEAWRLNTPGGPRLLVSRQDTEARRLLNVAAATE